MNSKEEGLDDDRYVPQFHISYAPTPPVRKAFDEETVLEHARQFVKSNAEIRIANKLGLKDDGSPATPPPPRKKGKGLTLPTFTSRDFRMAAVGAIAASLLIVIYVKFLKK